MLKGREVKGKFLEAYKAYVWPVAKKMPITCLVT